MRRSTLLPVLLSFAACTKYDPLYCDESMSCSDPARPFCDLAGEYPASDGVARTCIPSPFDAGAPDGGGAAADASAGKQDAAAGGDAATVCRWAPLSRLANVNSNTGDDYAGSLDADGLTLLLARVGTATDGIYVAARNSVGQVFGPPTLIDELIGDGADLFEPELSPSGLEILYRNDGSIDSATRSSPQGKFGTPAPTGLEGLSPSLSGDGLHLYFIATTNFSVQRATRTAIGAPWGPPESVIATGGYFSVDVSPDELHLLLDHPSSGTPETTILIADRSSTEEDFGPPVPANEELFTPGLSGFISAKWDGSRTRMVATGQVDPNFDVFYSECE
ncbi:MAG TPA: hypothetical protein VKB80_37535 [Kofleriaceae bacterium]|nr:hypothetical protein [Kofleriaceae bacterium]